MQRKLPNIGQYLTIPGMHAKSFWVSMVIFLSLLAAPAADNNVSMPFVSPMFGDNMVLQRGSLSSIWGSLEPGGTFQVEVAGDASKAVTGADGRWQFNFQP